MLKDLLINREHQQLIERVYPELSESDKDAVMIALQKAYFDCKQDNKKYTPKKYLQET